MKLQDELIKLERIQEEYREKWLTIIAMPRDKLRAQLKYYRKLCLKFAEQLKKHEWIPIKLPLTEAQPLPEVGEVVEWLYENGKIGLLAIGKDDDLAGLNRWLEGPKLNGRVTHWRRIVRPEEME